MPCVTGYNEDQVTIVLDDPGMKECPVILGMPTLYQVMEVIEEGQATQDDVANKPICPTAVDEVVKVSHKFCLPLFGHKVIHG